MDRVTYVFCNSCGHRNPPESSFCSSCGSPLDNLDDRTVTLTAVDPLLDAAGAPRRCRGADGFAARATPRS